MHVKVDSKITVFEPNKEIRALTKELKLDNPEYIKKEQMGLWMGKTPRYIYLYEENAGNLIFPFGLVLDIWDIYKGTCWKTDFAQNGEVQYVDNIKPYPYQEDVIKTMLKVKNGIIIMPCGSGKTQTALSAIARLGKKTLWITHTHELLKQSMERAKANIEGGWGTITEGKVNIGSHITFATIQTLVSLDLTQYSTAWDVVVVDECHKAIGSPTRVMMFYKVLSALKCRYKFGLTATAERADGLEKCMFALLGRTIAEVSHETVSDKTVPVIIQPVLTGFKPEPTRICKTDGTIDYAKAQNVMIDDAGRNDTIVEILKTNAGKSFIVLSDRVAHLHTLNDSLHTATQADEKSTSVVISASAKKSDKEARRTAIERMQTGELRVLFATYQLAKEGLDIPRLDGVIFAMPHKDFATIIQSCGRCSRKFENKPNGIVFDLVDDFGMYKGAFSKRKSHYKRVKYIVNEPTNILT